VRRLVLVALAACGSHATAPARPTTAQVAAASHAGLVVGPPLATPGEHMTYTLALQGLDLAVFDLTVGEVQPLGDKRALVVQSHAKTVGLGALVKVDDAFASWIDITTGRPLRWACDEYAKNGQDKEKTDADFAARSGQRQPITFHLNDDPPGPEPQRVSLPDVWDYDSFLIALRGWEGPVGTRLTAEVLRSRFLWHVEMTIHGKEELSTALGNLPALRLDGHTYKLDRDGQRAVGSDARDFSVWISDDEGRVPLQVAAKTDYGDIKMSITDYQPGTGQRLRP
jgi:hypothetical protein